jgi:hypothetical protein
MKNLNLNFIWRLRVGWLCSYLIDMKSDLIENAEMGVCDIFGFC